MAADIVFRSGVKVYAVGLDVTLQCILDQQLLGSFRTSADPANKLIIEWMDRWFDTFHFEKSVMHDPLAVASVFAPVCKFEKQYVRVVKEGEKRGAIAVARQEDIDFSPIYVAVSVDREGFYDLIREKLLGTGKM
jgi:inosine-uridine nucleoside N-ribohydrolase